MKPLIKFPLFYIKEVIVGVAQVALDVVRPQPQLAPVVLRLPVVTLHAKQRLILACLISMTPGTLSIGEDEDGDVMLIHSLYGAHAPESLINHIVSNYFPFVKSISV